MNNNANLNMAIGLLVDPNKSNLLTKFFMKLNASERTNFMKNSTNKKAFIRRWISAHPKIPATHSSATSTPSTTPFTTI